MYSYLWYLIVLVILFYLIYDTYRDGGFKETLKFVVIFGFLFIVIRTFLVQPFMVDGPSMSPTFETGHYLLVNKLPNYFDTPKRLDVVIFDIPDTEPQYHTCLIPNLVSNSCLVTSKRYLIKRVIGLPGEKVSVMNGVTTIYNKENPNGFILDESFVKHISYISDERTLKEDEYYVMGDNRANSSDSRYFGPVTFNKIVGSPLLRLWPIQYIGLKPGAVTE
jgi:signal peptidase I